MQLDKEEKMNNKTAFVSVIVTSYNYDRYLRTTLNSLMGQSFQDFEVIMVDDGSTDCSLQICEEYVRKDRRFKLFTHAGHENRGLAESIKLALGKARGEFVAFLESDDYWNTNHLEAKADYLKNVNPQAEILANTIELIGNINPLELEYIQACEEYLCQHRKENVFRRMVQKNLIPTFSGVMVKRKLLENCNFDSYLKPWLDYWLWLQLSFYHQIDFVSKAKTYWRSHIDSYNSVSAIDDKTEQRFITAATEFIWNHQVKNLYGKKVQPAFEQNNIPIVLAADDNYAPYLGVVIHSIIKNSFSGHNYDFIILETRISARYKDMIRSLSKGYKNVSIRFFDIQNLVSLKRDLLKVCKHFSEESYYRFFILNLCENFDRILYIDCDTLVCADIAELFKIEMGDDFLAAAKDVEMLRLIKEEEEFKTKNYTVYAEDVLGLKQVWNYFQSGVMVMNIKQMLKENVQDRLFFKLFEVGTPQLVDQDIFNAVCQGRVTFFSPEWNFEWQLNWRKDLKEHLTPQMFETIMRICEQPKIIHYCDGKPWKYPNFKLAHIWWTYARETPFYEEIIYRNTVLAAAAQPSDFQKYDYSLLRDALSFSRNRLKYWRYVLYSKILSGKKRQKYAQKSEAMRKRLKLAHALLKGKEWLLSA